MEREWIAYFSDDDARVWAAQVSDDIWQKKVDLNRDESSIVDDECSMGGVAIDAVKVWWGLVKDASAYVSLGWKERLD